MTSLALHLQIMREQRTQQVFVSLHRRLLGEKAKTLERRSGLDHYPSKCPKHLGSERLEPMSHGMSERDAHLNSSHLLGLTNSFTWSDSGERHQIESHNIAWGTLNCLKLLAASFDAVVPSGRGRLQI
mmetsp:Transcript_94111/g.147119  ORF Transcript_94111/g.147119 Transcript_94111/m.147119 type:complete len:128 (+) Transcript_94111:797-1180(+)